MGRGAASRSRNLAKGVVHPACGKSYSPPEPISGTAAECPFGKHVSPAAANEAPVPPSWLRRRAKLIVATVAMAFVLLASLWGGMAMKGGPDGPPTSLEEIWNRLTQQSAKVVDE